MSKYTFTSKRAQTVITQILGALATDRMSSKALATAVGMSLSSVTGYLAHLQKEPRRVRIAGYAHGFGPVAPLYGLGSAPDAKRRKRDYQCDRSKRQIARILVALADGPLTMAQLAERLHITRSGVNLYLKLLQAEPRRVRIADYQRNSVRPFNLYALGSEPDLPFVRTRKLRRKKVKEKTAQEVACEQLLTVLAGDSQTVIELARRLKVSISYVREHMKTLHGQRKVYVSRWEYPNGRGALSAVYAVGKNRSDKARPIFDRKEYEKRVQADPVRREARLARRRFQDMLRTAPQTPFSALFTRSQA